MSRRSRTRAEPTWLRPGIGWRSGRGVRNAPCEPKGELEGELEGEPEMAGGREGADGGVSARARAVDLRGEKPDTAQGWGGREVGTSAGMSREAHHYARGAARGRGPYHHAATIEVVEEGAVGWLVGVWELVCTIYGHGHTVGGVTLPLPGPACRALMRGQPHIRYTTPHEKDVSVCRTSRLFFELPRLRFPKS